MAKSDLQLPPSQRPGETAAVQALANPGLIDDPLAKAEHGEDRARAAAPAAKTASHRGRYRRVFACATGLTDGPNEERPS